VGNTCKYRLNAGLGDISKLPFKNDEKTQGRPIKIG